MIFYSHYRVWNACWVFLFRPVLDEAIDAAAVICVDWKVDEEASNEMALALILLLIASLMGLILLDVFRLLWGDWENEDISRS